MKTYLVNTILAIIFFLFNGFFSTAAADSTSHQTQQFVAQPLTASTPKQIASSQKLPVVTLPEVVCTAKRTLPLSEVLIDKIKNVGFVSIELPKIRMIDFSAAANEILDMLK